MGGTSSTRVDEVPLELDLALDLERDDDAEQRGALDERGENQRGGLDAGGGVRLARHAFDGLTTDASDAESGADDGESGTESGADSHQAARARCTSICCCLQHGKDRVNHGSISNRAFVERQRPAASLHRRPSPRPGSQRTSPAARPGTWLVEGRNPRALSYRSSSLPTLAGGEWGMTPSVRLP